MPQHVKAWLALLALPVLLGAAASRVEAQSPALLTSTTIYADITPSGSIQGGNGVVSANRLGTGVYEVLFNRDITTCAFAGTIASLASSGSVNPGQIAVVGRAGTTNGVFVTTQDSGGNGNGRPFMLSIYCP